MWPRASRALDMVRLRQFGDRRPGQLSGGQQQRVALARALVFEPSLVLMDEPLGALDKKLREHMQIEIKQLHPMLGVTIVYVTHDQSEALTMSDRVAVFNDGGVAQVGTPDALYNEPASPFVASFIGENNTLEGVVDNVSGNECRVALQGGGHVAAHAPSTLICRAGPARSPSGPNASGSPPAPMAKTPSRPRSTDGSISATICGSSPGFRMARSHRESRAGSDDGERRERHARLVACGLPRISGPSRTDEVIRNKGASHETPLDRRLALATAAACLGLVSRRLPPKSSPSWPAAAHGRRRSATPGSSPSPRNPASRSCEQEYLGDLGKVKAMVDTGNVPIDLVTVETATVLQGCDAGILEVLDYSKIADRSKFLEGSALDCGVGLDAYGDVLAYDPTVLKDGPTSVLDIFDTTNFPGKRAMRKFPAQNLEWALMADGVPPAEVYEVLATPEGVERAFKKLDTIKDDIVWWEAGAQPPQLLASQEVVMTTAWNGRIQNAIDKDCKPFKIVWDGQILEYDMIAIPKGARNPELAYKYLAYISQPEINAKLASLSPTARYASTRPSSSRPTRSRSCRTRPTHMKSYLVADTEFWGDYGEDLVKRFNAWLAQ